ncbi:MAG: peptidase M28 [Erysipelotrichaceae bacterium]
MNLKMLKDYCFALGVSGNEKAVSKVMKNYLVNCVDETFYDNLGSLVSLKKGDSQFKVMLMGHMDEIGLIVSRISDDGYLFVSPIGGINPTILLNELVDITTRDNQVYSGVVGSDFGKNTPTMDKIYIDLGLSSKKDVLDKGIKENDVITFRKHFEVLNGSNNILGSCFDDRIGVYIITKVMQEISKERFEYDLYCVGSTQEEVGLRGSKTSTHLVDCDIAVNVDVTYGDDTPNNMGSIKLGKGVAIGLCDGSVLGNRGMVDYFIDLCQRLKLDYQFDSIPLGGTDSGSIFSHNIGVFTLTLSIPQRYMHQGVGIINSKDVDDCVKIIVEFLKEIDFDLLEKIKLSNR